MTRALALAVLGVLLLAPAAAWAQPLRVAIAKLEGGRATATRKALAEALAARGELVLDFAEVDAARARHGGRAARIMDRLDAEILVEGRATASGVDLRVHRRGAPRAERLRSTARDASTRLEEILAGYEAIRREVRVESSDADEAESAAEEIPLELPSSRAEGAELEAPAAEPLPPRKKRRIPRDEGLFPRAIEAGVSLGLLSRKLRFQDDVFDRVGGYSLGAAPALGFYARAFPATSLHLVGLEDLGIALRGEQDFIKSSSREGVTFRTYGARWDLDLLYRFPLGRFQAVAWLGYHRRVFSIDSAIARPPGNNLPGVPNVRYQAVRLGGEGRMHLVDQLFADLRLSYLFVVDAGAIHSALWFPHGRAGGLEISGNLVYRFTSFMSVKLGVGFERYHHRFNPELGDRTIVGGAADRYTVYELGLGFHR